MEGRPEEVARVGQWGKEEGVGAEMLRSLTGWTAARKLREGDIQKEADGTGLRTGE